MRTRPVVALLAVMLAATACSSSDDGSDPGSAEAAQAPGSTESQPDEETPAPPQDDAKPLVIGMTSQDSGPRSNPDFADGLAAWVEWVNSEGGIDGRPVELRRCDSSGEANGEQQCSQQLASDESVLAVSGMGGFVGTMSVPTYEAQEVPMVSVSMFVPQEYNTPIGVALNGGLISTYAGLMQHFQDQGAATASMLRVDVASAASVAEQYEDVAERLGLTWAGTTAVAPTATDVLPSVTQALSGDPDMLLTQTHPAQLKGILQAMDTLGSDVPVLSTGGSVTLDIFELPEARGRLYFTSDFADPSEDDEHAEAYEHLTSTFDTVLDPHVLGFILGEAFGQAIEGGGGADATRASILEFVQNGTFEGLPWMPEEISRSDAPSSYPAVANLGVYAVQVDENGEKSYVSDLIIPREF